MFDYIIKKIMFFGYINSLMKKDIYIHLFKKIINVKSLKLRTNI